MDKEPQKQGFSWDEEYLRHLEERKITAASPAMASYMAKKDVYVPPVIGDFTEADLKKLLLLLPKLDQASKKIAYYGLYRKVIEKLIVLLIEQFPETFAGLDPSLKDRLFGAKIDFPNEQALYQQIYIYWLGRERLPMDMIATGLSLRELLNRVMDEEPEVIDERLIGMVSDLDYQYSLYFLDNMPEK